MIDRQKRSRLFVAIFAYFFCVATIPLAILSVMGYTYTKRSIIKHIEKKLIAIGDGRQALIEQVMTDISAFITERASGPTPIKAFHEIKEAFYGSGTASESYKALDAIYGNTFHTYLDINSYLYDILFISVKGDIIFSIRHESDLGRNIYDPDFYSHSLSKAVDSAALFLTTSPSDFDLYPPSDQPALFVAAPILSEDKLLGTIVFQIKPETLYNFAVNYTGLPTTGDIVLFKLSGNKVIATTPMRFYDNAALNYSVQVGSRTSIPAQKAVTGDTGVGFAVDYRGKDVLARWSYLPRLHWGMVVKVDRDEILQPIYDMRNLSLITFLVMFALLLVISLLVARMISHPIELVRNDLRKIGEGDFEHRINLKRNDEIGELADDVDKMAGNLSRSSKELKKANDELARSERMAAIGKLASSVAHEIRNPLGVIKNAAYFLNMLDTIKNNKDASEHVGIISQEVDNSEKIISDMLEFARAKRPALKPVDLNMIIKSVLGRIKLGPGIDVILDLSDKLPIVEADALHMNQIFYNLIQNASEAMPKGGKLTIRSRVEGNHGPYPSRIRAMAFRMISSRGYSSLYFRQRRKGPDWAFRSALCWSKGMEAK